MNQWHKERYGKIHWAGIDVYVFMKKIESPSLKINNYIDCNLKCLFILKFNWEFCLYLFSYIITHAEMYTK